MNNICILGILFFGILMIFAFIGFTRELKGCSADFPKEEGKMKQ
jgi:hypothetical protein